MSFLQTEIWLCPQTKILMVSFTKPKSDHVISSTFIRKKKLVLISTRKILLLVFSPKNTCWWCFSSKTTFSIFKRKFGSAQIWCAIWKKFIMHINNSMNTYNMNSICKRLVVYLPLAIRSSCWNRFNLWFPNSNLFFLDGVFENKNRVSSGPFSKNFITVASIKPRCSCHHDEQLVERAP